MQPLRPLHVAFVSTILLSLHCGEAVVVQGKLPFTAAMAGGNSRSMACFGKSMATRSMACVSAGTAAGAWPLSVAREKEGRRRWPLFLGLCLGLSMGLTAFGSLSLAHAAPIAASASATLEKPHVGQRVAIYLRSSLQIPDWAILCFLSALPLVELRGGVPVGLWMGKPWLEVLFLCILGNMIPIPLILVALRSEKVKQLLRPLLHRAESKMKAIGGHDRWVGVAAFVGVPLPGTGAWTGAMVAYLLGMELQEAVTSIFAGVCVAGCIMASLTLAGWYGCGVATIVCAIALFSRTLPFLKR